MYPTWTESHEVLDVHGDLAFTHTGIYIIPPDLVEQAQRKVKSTTPHRWKSRHQFKPLHEKRRCHHQPRHAFTCDYDHLTWSCVHDLHVGNTIAFTHCAIATPPKIGVSTIAVTEMQRASAQSALRLGVVPSDAYMAYNYTKKKGYTWVDTFNLGPVPLFGMPRSDNPALVAMILNSCPVILVLRDVQKGDPLTLPSDSWIEHMRDENEDVAFLTTTPYQRICNMDTVDKPPNTQVVETNGEYVRKSHGLHTLRDLRCIVGSVPLCRSEKDAIPDNVLFVQKDGLDP